MSSRCSTLRSAVIALSLSGIVTLASGCHRAVGTLADERASESVVTTPSVDAVRSARIAQRTLQRPHAAAEVPVPDGTVTHTPLYFEDPFEDAGCDDGRIAWRAGDYAYLLYGPSRFLVNTAMFPISAVMTPPWLVTSGDGSQGRPEPVPPAPEPAG